MIKRFFYIVVRGGKKILSLPLKIAPLYIYAFLTVIVIILFLFGKIPLLTLNGAILTFSILSLTAYYQHKIQKNETMLVSFTAKYLLEKHESYVDEIFGLLISGKFKKVKIDAISEFFECIKNICLSSDYEMRRRSAEALPALFYINKDKAKEIYEILRKDWDDRWKADIRRRAIEGLICLIGKDDKYLCENCYVIDNDQIFTIIALVEMLGALGNKIGYKKADKYFENIKAELNQRGFNSDEILAINELWELLKLVNKKQKLAIDRCESLCDSNNECVQICVARNLKVFHKKYPERTLDLLERFIQDDKAKNVRRPIAKEESVECLLNLCEDKKCSYKAQDILWKLLTDNDTIIRLAAFDKIEKIISVNKEFGERILRHVIDHDTEPRLKERAQIILDRL